MSLFPFLAVLICTMGSLILLLVVIARQARLQGLQTTSSDPERVRREIKDELDAAQLLAVQFDASREATQGDLEAARFKLGQIEDHAGELRRQLEGLETAWRHLNELETGKKSSRQAAESELAELTLKIGQLQRELELAKAEAAQRKAAYSIVPYEGPQGTRRRPVYIECCGDGLVIQPEGLRFGPEDFEGPLDAGNPLDVALRAVREYLAAQQKLRGTDDSEPYPLLLVRPSGIVYFYAGRAAMKSWGSEFGYELIGEDWELEYPQPDPVLQRAVAEAVEPARARQQRLIAVAPSQYGGKGDRPVYTVAPYRGGVRVRDRNDDEEDLSLSLRPSGAGNRYGSQYDSTGLGTRVGDRRGGPLRGSDGAGVAGTPGLSPQSELSGAGSPGKGNKFFEVGQMERSVQVGGAASGGRARGSLQPSGSASGSSSPGVADSAGAAGLSSGSPTRAAGDTSAGEGGGPGEQNGTSSPGRNAEAPQSLAKTRGRNWGLPDATQTAVAITRPVKVECHPDRLVIVPEAGLGQSRTVAVTGRTDTAVDSFVSEVWDYMEGWGKAGRGMYWRPMLSVYVAPDAELRMAELEALLHESGLLIKHAGRLPSGP